MDIRKIALCMKCARDRNKHMVEKGKEALGLKCFDCGRECGVAIRTYVSVPLAELEDEVQ